ncbi:hypothetical protein [Flavipsychrobacter stenotrophus]|nr:hypothetical protein [Flavipsychrobacter stenotrophus]
MKNYCFLILYFILGYNCYAEDKFKTILHFREGDNNCFFKEPCLLRLYKNNELLLSMSSDSSLFICNLNLGEYKYELSKTNSPVYRGPIILFFNESLAYGVTTFIPVNMSAYDKLTETVKEFVDGDYGLWKIYCTTYSSTHILGSIPIIKDTIEVDHI